MTGKRGAVKAQATGGDKGSKKTNDFETSGRDRAVSKAVRHPENFGRQGMDNEKTSRKGDTEKNVRGRERTTEAGVVASNETKNHSQIKAQAEPGDSDRKPRKTSKGERGSRKPGTELTKDERASKAS